MMQARLSLAQRTASTSSTTTPSISHTNSSLQAHYDQMMKEQEESHKKEMRKTIKDFMGQMKGQRMRMENLADRIKDLIVKGREKSETMHDMAMEISTLKSHNEAQKIAIQKLRNSL